MQKNTSQHPLAAKFCLLVLGALLFLAGCGSSYSSPGSQPNSTPQATPTKSGYSVIYIFDKEIQFFLARQKR